MKSYEERIIKIMSDCNCTFAAAMQKDFESIQLDTSSVFDLVDYLEFQLGDLDKVAYIMGIYVGNEPDMKLKVIK